MIGKVSKNVGEPGLRVDVIQLAGFDQRVDSGGLWPPNPRMSNWRDLEHVPKKLIDFFDKNMLQLFESERFLFDQMIPSDREAL
jgi:hypothetical protein